MADLSVREEIEQALDSMTPEMQKKVLDYLNTLAGESVKDPTGKGILKFAGMLTPEEAAEWMQVIDEECERIDPNEW